MSDDDVHGFEMDAPHPLDDEATEALLRGSGRDVDPSLADLVGDLRVAFTSSPPTPGAALAAFLTTGSETPATTSRRSERMLSSLLAKVGAATAAVFAATGGLAMASALPAPIQDAVSHLGVGAPAHHGHSSHSSGADADETTSTTVSSEPTDETTTVPDGSTSTTVAREHPDNHGGEVSAVAHDDSLEGCEHGQAVAAVASNGKAQGKSEDKPCPSTTSTTLADGTTTTTVAGNEGGDDQGEDPASTNPGADHADTGRGNSGDHGNAGDHGNGSSGEHGNG
jgi:hypothetical protein